MDRRQSGSYPQKQVGTAQSEGVNITSDGRIVAAPTDVNHSVHDRGRGVVPRSDGIAPQLGAGAGVQRIEDATKGDPAYTTPFATAGEE